MLSASCARSPAGPPVISTMRRQHGSCCRSGAPLKPTSSCSMPCPAYYRARGHAGSGRPRTSPRWPLPREMPPPRRGCTRRWPSTGGGWSCGRARTRPPDLSRTIWVFSPPSSAGLTMRSTCWRTRPPWLAHTLAALADALARRNGDGDGERASGHRRQARAIAQQLGMAALLASLSAPADEWTLRREGSDWLLTAASERARLRDSRGLHYLRALLAAPGREITSLDLAAGGSGLCDTWEGHAVLDATARDAYRRRLSALAVELEHADSTGDSARAERAEAEKQALLDELGHATGLGGRTRRVSAEDERARVNVTRTLRAAIGRISAAAPTAGAHLAASVRTGRDCRYQPAPGGPSRWHV